VLGFPRCNLIITNYSFVKAREISICKCEGKIISPISLSYISFVQASFQGMAIKALHTISAVIKSVHVELSPRMTRKTPFPTTRERPIGPFILSTHPGRGSLKLDMTMKVDNKFQLNCQLYASKDLFVCSVLQVHTDRWSSNNQWYFAFIFYQKYFTKPF